MAHTIEEIEQIALQAQRRGVERLTNNYRRLYKEARLLVKKFEIIESAYINGTGSKKVNINDLSDDMRRLRDLLEELDTH